MNVFSLTYFLFAQTFNFLVVVVVAGVLIFLVARKLYTRKVATIAAVVFFLGSLPFLWSYLVPGRGTTFGPAAGPTIPLKSVLAWFKKSPAMEQVVDIARDPNDVPPPITRTAADQVKISLETKEVIGTMAEGVEFNYWTFNGTVPGPLLRVREGDTVELTITNDPTSIHDHNIDLHAVTGPGGGATVTTVKPGEAKTFTFKALNPGLYVYHCAHPNVATHMAHGMYGLILVEPAAGLPPVDKEFYIMQGEFYSLGPLGKKGLQIFNAEALLDGQPDYIPFNGRVKGTVGNMSVNTGDRVRLYVGNGGVNLISSFHVIGEIFDTVYPEAALGDGSSLLHNVQTTLIPAGGASIVEFTVDVPGTYILVDHALARLDRGAWGTIQALGEHRPEIFYGTADPAGHGH